MERIKNLFSFKKTSQNEGKLLNEDTMEDISILKNDQVVSELRNESHNQTYQSLKRDQTTNQPQQFLIAQMQSGDLCAQMQSEELYPQMQSEDLYPQMQSEDLYPQMQSEDLYAQMQSQDIQNEVQKRGIVFMINNVKFDNHLPREGAEKDEENLKELFKQIGFHKFILHKDLSHEQAKAKLKAFAKSAILKRTDCVFFIISSHGISKNDQTFIICKDGWLIRTEKIIEYFNSKNCKHLQKIPKIFIFQACRENSRDCTYIHTLIGKVKQIFICNTKEDSALTLNVKKKIAKKQNPLMKNYLKSWQSTLYQIYRCSFNFFYYVYQLFYNTFYINLPFTRFSKSIDNTQCDGFSSNVNLRLVCDTIIVNSTIPGYNAYRDANQGSWYFISMCEVFQKHCHEEHLDTLFMLVDDYLHSLNLSETKTQTSSIEKRGFNQYCFLNPRIFEE